MRVVYNKRVTKYEHLVNKAKELVLHKKPIMFLFVTGFSIFGVLVIFIGHAVAPSVANEVENGHVFSPAISVNDTTASNSHAVVFGPTLPMATKPPIQGLLDRGSLNYNADPPGKFSLPVEPYLDAIGGVVANVRWSDLQPTSDGAIQRSTAVNQLETALAAVRTYNASHASHQIYVKLRINAGIFAPDWAKSIGGFTPVRICSNQTTTFCGTIGPFWRSDYGAAYADFNKKLADIYDTDPLVRDVTIAQCMTVYDEPFQRDDSGFTTANIPDYTVTADHNCLTNEIDNHAVWTHTRSSLAFNTYKPLVATGGVYAPGARDEVFTASIMDHCRAVLGRLCTLENNSIRKTFIGQERTAGNLYFDLLAKGPNSTYQTSTFNRLCGTDPTPPCTGADLQATILWAVNSLKANAVELPHGYDALDAGTLASDNAALINNTVN